MLADMHVVIVCVGSRGDCQPWLALARSLNEQQYRVTLCADWVRLGDDAVGCSDHFLTERITLQPLPMEAMMQVYQPLIHGDQVCQHTCKPSTYTGQQGHAHAGPCA